MSRVPVKNGAFQNGGSSVQWSQFQPPRHTAIPLREQCRIRRFFFFYHDIRAFTTSVSETRNSTCGGWRQCPAAALKGCAARALVMRSYMGVGFGVVRVSVPWSVKVIPLQLRNLGTLFVQVILCTDTLVIP